ncbi:MAG: filamentous hemagglutinin N-terminal domain-containing protein, partial [Proteobacteria bacterium]|nr:filamentous hemagglutinin N-terminal domain-containing protein [Pseudomonadota bacterium]
MKYLKLFILLIFSINLHAEITLDNTLNNGGALKGPDYMIGAELGQRHGSNLFHSFAKFNINLDESATFSGPNNINNIISRVTGGSISNIDGMLTSTIPNANFYLINPAGLIFGPNATLDVQGSFHASSANTLYLQDGGQFNATNPQNSNLTVAPITSFGFLNNAPA